MGRRPTIDRDRVLDLAEGILLRSGTSGLTIDAVAKAAGVSKGGIQSRFGTKDALVEAMMERWEQEYDAQAKALAGPAPTPVEAVRAHLRITIGMVESNDARAAAMVAALIEASHHMASVRSWYAERFGALDVRSGPGRRARLALLAAEGLFTLRALGAIQEDDAMWRGIGEDLLALLDGKTPAG